MTIIQKLRVQIIVGTSFVLMFVLAVILLVLNISITRRETAEVMQFVKNVADNRGELPLPGEAPGQRGKGRQNPSMKLPEMAENDTFNDFYQNDFRQNSDGEILDVESGATPFKPDAASRSVFSQLLNLNDLGIRNCLTLHLDTAGKIKEVIHRFPLFYSSEDMQALVFDIMQLKEPTGFYSVFAYAVQAEDAEGYLLVLLNCQAEFNTIHRFYFYSVLVWAVSLIFTALASWLLSGLLIRPVEEAFVRQKNFISDASHELKTPIAVISANIDVLIPDMPDNRWLQYIKAENERMSRLVKDLLFLARDDAGRSVTNVSTFDFTQAMENAILPFESVIFEDGKKLEMNIEKDITYSGDEQKIKQVVIILVDNAIKNSEKGALIRVNVKKESQKVVLSVYNTGHGITEGDLHKIFLRFYRSDASRARNTGGYGLGLAIAKAIVDSHHGTIDVDSKYGEWAEFTVTLPLLTKHS